MVCGDVNRPTEKQDPSDVENEPAARGCSLILTTAPPWLLSSLDIGQPAKLTLRASVDIPMPPNHFDSPSGIRAILQTLQGPPICCKREGRDATKRAHTKHTEN
ncbi:hypothetical protein E2320_006522 [Naja naja]|nr:hypothetical protein E2320_006522 [Naja naja]